MNDETEHIRNAIDHALSGQGAHVGTKDLFQGLGWKAAGMRPEAFPHSLFQLLNHLNFWQDWVVEWLDGGNPKVPKHAAGGWPGRPRPTNAKEWQRAVRKFRSGLTRLARQASEADLLTERGKHSRLEMLQAIASHNSYHAGQVVVLRRVLGKWPPLSGGLTW